MGQRITFGDARYVYVMSSGIIETHLDPELVYNPFLIQLLIMINNR
jgi:hypothetical protein